MPTDNESSEHESGEHEPGEPTPELAPVPPAERDREPDSSDSSDPGVAFPESERYRPAPVPFRIASMPGVTITKWTGIWAERFRRIPLEFLKTTADADSAVNQVDVIRSGSADVSFVRLPIDRDGLNAIPLYSEVPVVVFAKDHDLAAAESVDVSELADERILDAVEDSFELSAAGVGVIIAPHSIARLYNRKDLLTRPLTGVEPTQIALVWAVDLDDTAAERVNEFIGIVRGRGANSSRGTPTPPTDKRAARKKAAAQAGNAKGRGGSSSGGKGSAGKGSAGKSRRPRQGR